MLLSQLPFRKVKFKMHSDPDLHVVMCLYKTLPHILRTLKTTEIMGISEPEKLHKVVSGAVIHGKQL